MGIPIFTQFRKRLGDYGLEWFNRYYSDYRGFVVKNDDPENIGRLIVRVPQIFGSYVREYWAIPKGLYSGDGYGNYVMPEVGDMVWVSFECGDPDFPLWQYGHWNLKNKRPAIATSTDQKVFQTKSGLRLVFDDDKKTITIWKSDSRAIEINDSGISIGKSGESEYKAVLGEKNEEVLDLLTGNIEDALQAIIEFGTTEQAAISSAAPLAPLLPGFTKLTSDAISLMLELQEVKAKIPLTKSTVVSVD